MATGLQGPVYDPPPPKQETMVEYVWDINASDLRSLWALDSKAALESPSFHAILSKCEAEWRVQLTVGPHSNGSFVDHLNVMLKLVSMWAGPFRTPPNEIAVRYCFILHFQNWTQLKDVSTSMPMLFCEGQTSGTNSICTLQHLKDNLHLPIAGVRQSVHLHCKLWIEDGLKINSIGAVLGDYVANRQFQSLTTFMKSMLNDCSSADIRLKVGKETFHAHKNILSARSKVFAAMFGSNMEEARNCTVEIDDFEPEIVQAMLQYIYYGDIAAAKDKPFDLLKIADKYELLELKDECERFIVPSLTVANVAQALICTYEHNLKASWPEIKKFVNRNKPAISKTEWFKKVAEEYPMILYDLFLSD